MNGLIRLINRLSQDMLFFSLVHTNSCLYDFTRQILVVVDRLKLITVVADGNKTLSRASILM